MKLGWLTDPHLNCAREFAHHRLAGALAELAPDALLLTGDLHEAPGLLSALDWVAHYARCPVYFVLGNHDFYRCASIPALRAEVSAHCATSDALHYMPDQPFITLVPGTALVGHDGWGDARAGAPLTTPVMLADFHAIPELAGLARPALIAKLQALGDEAAEQLEGALQAALVDHAHVIALMHVPPFVHAAWHEGAASNEDWAPFFVCVAAGEALLRVAAAHPTRRITVLCGHTHGAGELWPLPNLHVRTGGAEYGAPALQPPLWIV
jgi:3',5'-cyclic-AMP phosphodiesterase